MVVRNARTSAQYEPTKQLLQHLAGHRMFGVLSPEVLADLAADCAEREYERGHRLCYSGDPAAHVFSVESGTVAMTALDRLGNSQVLMLFYTGDTFGFGVTLLGQRWAWTATALTRSKVLVVEKARFDRLYRQFPDLAYKVTDELLGILNRSQQIALRRTLGPAIARVAGFLLDSVEDQPDSNEQLAVVNLVLSHRDLAQIIGTSRETITRAFTRLSRARLITVRDDRVVILQYKALRELAGC